MITGLRAIVLALCLSLAMPALAQIAPATPPASGPPSVQRTQVPDSDKAKPKEDQHTATGEVPILKPTKAPQDQAASRNSADNSNGVGVTHDSSSPEALTAKFTFWLMIATALLAVATFALAVSTRGLYKETKRLADEAVSQGEKTERQIVISERSAVAANNAAQAAIDALNIERAWMTPDDLFFIDAKNANVNGIVFNNALSLQAKWSNTGRSPATDVKILVDMRVVPFASNAPRFDISDNPDDHPYSGVIGINKVALSGHRPIYGKDYEDFVSRKVKVYLYSKVFYKTIGDKEKVKYSEACMEIVHNGVQRNSNGEIGPNLFISLSGLQNTAV
ncbi:hypothetical protein [Methylobacterium radiotolerans]|uniref:hypothetical protein n=1 Tax=Methylobacterium radiotolerans TaxID=31998 RepID=UPI000D5CE57C|nr:MULTISPECIES: hypothetical protein [Methylobacterium]MDE3749460.1 hypothetical protein [Methylobacterium radiotolerans]PVZ03710.1 hypothetical protein C7388_1097 [Methylobacterium organophilum]